MNKKITFFISVIVFALFATACGGVLPGSWPGFTVTQDNAYLANASFVYAIKLSDGTQAWKYPAQAVSGQSFYAQPVLTQDSKQLLVGDYSNTLSSLDPTNGNLVWSFKDAKGHWIGSPLVTADTIFAPNVDYSLYALDYQGKQIWKFSTNAALWAQPTMNGNVLYQGSMDHFLYAINATEGKQVWKTDLGAAIISSPVLDSSGVLYVGTLGNEILAVQASDGKILWRSATTGAIWSPLSLNNGALYAGDLSGTVYALSADEGKILWQQTIGGAIAGSPAVIQNGIVVGNDAGVLTAVDFNDKPLWSKTFSGKLYTSPVVQNDRIYIAISGSSDSSLLVALDLSGNQKWSFVPPK